MIGATDKKRALQQSIILGALATGALTVAPPASAQPGESSVSGYVTVSSDYRRRGLSQSGGRVSAQLGGDWQHGSGIFAGGWLASVEYRPAHDYAGGSTRAEVAAYAGYNRRAGDWSLTVTGSRYAYPGAAFDYDYAELAAAVSYRDRLFLTSAHSDDLYGLGASASNHELGATLPLPRRVELSASVGRLDAAEQRVTHYNAGVSRTFAGRLGIDLRYYDDDGAITGPLAETSGGRWVISASYGFAGR